MPLPNDTHVLHDLSARAAIEDLVNRYAMFVRRGDGGRCEDLFAADATYDIMMVEPSSPANTPSLRRRLTGRDAIRDFLVSTGSSGVRLCPLIHNLVVTVDGDRASSECVMESRTWPKGHEAIGEYHDTYRQFEGRWLFQSRNYTMFVPEEAA